jgi:hypothetical protein
MRGFLAFLFLALVALGAGAVGYQAGASSIATTAAAAGGTAVVYVGGWHAGWLLFPFGILLFPLFLFSFFGFLAFAFGGRRRHWGGGFGPMGMHRGFGQSDDHDPRRQWVAEAHRRLHEEEAARTGSTSTGTGAAPDGQGGRTAG